MSKRYLIAAALLIAAPAMAQAAAAPAAPDPARVVLAHKVVDAVFPLKQRDQMMASMVYTIMRNMEAGIMQLPDFPQGVAQQPKARPIFQAFIERQHQETLGDLKQNMPGLLDAMAQAYARRFDAAQLTGMLAFFTSPTGQAYVQESADIMSDPAIATWQTKVADDAMKRVPAETTKLKADLTAAGVTDTQ